MDDEREMGPKFARMQSFLGAWALGGISILMFLGASPVLGVVSAFVGLVMLMVAITGLPERKRPYSRIELFALWTGFPMVAVTFIVLVTVGFLPGTYGPWVIIYLAVAALIFIMMIIEARKHQRPV